METINYNLDGLHQVQKNLLAKLMQVCEEQKLTWFLAFGSLIGAVRGHKILPWDDSIDVVMPYPDYMKLLALPKETWGEDLFLQTHKTDPKYNRIYARLRDSRTTLIKVEDANLDIHHGIYMNIMPIIRLSDDPEDRRRQIHNAKLYKAMAEDEPLSSEELPLKIISSILLASSDHKKVRTRDELLAKLTAYENADTRDCFVLAGSRSIRLVLSRAWFAEALPWEFEDMQVRIPCGWKEWLTLRYGDYTEVPIPDVQAEKVARFVTVSTDRPYTEYKGKSYCAE
ncbi:MAG: LicD family protein [Lachnospiraceae bacterium]|nr:LicD family protein [Lachnospiraceae bacterium]